MNARQFVIIGVPTPGDAPGGPPNATVPETPSLALVLAALLALGYTSGAVKPSAAHARCTAGRSNIR